MAELKPRSAGAIRIVVWNAHAGFHNKFDRFVNELRPDVAIVPEACNEGRLRKAGATEFSSMAWIGRFPNRGVAAIGFDKTTVSMNSKAWDQRLEWVLPTTVKATAPFNLFACWVKNKSARIDIESNKGLTQEAQLLDAYDQILNNSVRPTVIAGDFNNCTRWDKGTGRDFSRLVERHADLGLVSAYHRFTGEAFGNESKPTFWSTYSSTKPFHIDYCFVPADWEICQVWVGGFSDWIRKGDGSDHAPLVIDVVPSSAG